jgi:uncharacterized coiled-coil protein SlyX
MTEEEKQHGIKQEERILTLEKRIDEQNEWIKQANLDTAKQQTKIEKLQSNLTIANTTLDAINRLSEQ